MANKKLIYLPEYTSALVDGDWALIQPASELTQHYKVNVSKFVLNVSSNIWYVSSDGNDSNSGLYPGDSFNTLGAAIIASSDYDVIYLLNDPGDSSAITITNRKLTVIGLGTDTSGLPYPNISQTVTATGTINFRNINFDTDVTLNNVSPLSLFNFQNCRLGGDLTIAASVYVYTNFIEVLSGTITSTAAIAQFRNSILGGNMTVNSNSHVIQNTLLSGSLTISGAYSVSLYNSNITGNASGATGTINLRNSTVTGTNSVGTINDDQVSAGSTVLTREEFTSASTTGDNQDTGVDITSTPAGDVSILVDGIGVELAGDKTHDCYFSADGGTTARALSAIVAGDSLYWNGTINGAKSIPVIIGDLTTNDRITLIY